MPFSYLPAPSLPLSVPLSSSSPAIRNALEIGRKGELYIFERNFKSALEAFKSALGELVPLLQTEPKGQRRDMMHQITQFWLQEAESLKSILSAQCWEAREEQISNKLAVHSHCSLQ